MQKTVFKMAGIASLIVLASSILAINAPAYAIWGHGVSYGPQYGAGPYDTYSDGLKINGISFDISKSPTSIPTQKLYVSTPNMITVKIYHHASPKFINHVALFMNLKGSLPATYKSDTSIAWDRYSGVTTIDPHGMIKSATANIAYDKNYMYITFEIKPASTMDTSHLIIQSWDNKLSAGTEIVMNAISIGYLPESFSR